MTLRLTKLGFTRSTLALSVLLSASPASASEASNLFDEAVRLLDQKRYAEACKKLERSQELEPAAGTLLNLGGCYESLGDKRKALVIFHEAKESARARQRADWLRIAEEHIRTLEKEENETPPKPVRIEPERPHDPPPPPPPPNNMRLAGFVIGGVGAGSLIFGSVAALVASSALDEAKSNCASYPGTCSPDAQAPNDRAGTWSTISTVSFIAGGALLATGAVLVLLPGPKGTSVGFAPAPLGGTLRVRF